MKLKGLERGSMYREQESGKSYSADALMQAGIPLPVEMGEYQAYQMYFVRVDEKKSFSEECPLGGRSE